MITALLQRLVMVNVSSIRTLTDFVVRWMEAFNFPSYFESSVMQHDQSACPITQGLAPSRPGSEPTNPTGNSARLQNPPATIPRPTVNALFFNQISRKHKMQLTENDILYDEPSRLSALNPIPISSSTLARSSGKIIIHTLSAPKSS